MTPPNFKFIVTVKWPATAKEPEMWLHPSEHPCLDMADVVEVICEHFRGNTSGQEVGLDTVEVIALDKRNGWCADHTLEALRQVKAAYSDYSNDELPQWVAGLF